MSAETEGDTSGTWRNQKFVLWTDVFVPLKALVYTIVLIALGYALILPMLARQGMSPPQIRLEMTNLMRTPLGIHAVTAFSDLVMVFFVWRIARRVADSSLVARYRAVRGVTIVIAAIGGVALSIATLHLTAQLQKNGIVEFHPRPNERIFVPGPWAQYPVIVVTIGLIAPFLEEFYFRGVLLSWLARKITIVPAALVSAALFGLVHLRFVGHPGGEGWVFTGIIALVGLINAAIAIRTRSLWPAFALHAAYNLTLVSLALVAVAVR